MGHVDASMRSDNIIGPRKDGVCQGFARPVKSKAAGQLAEFLNTPRRLGALGHASTEVGHRMLRAEWDEEERLREDAKNLRLLEWAKELLLDEE